MKISKGLYFVLLLCMVFVSCTEKKKLSTTTSGELTVSVDETFSSVINAEEEVFETLYPKAALTMMYKPEAEVLNDFLKDSTTLIILSRELNEEEKEYFKSKKITTRENKIAVDAIALIINKTNTDSTLELSQVREIIRGKIKSWKELDVNTKLGNKNITLVFDNKNSSTVRYITEMVGLKEINSPSVYALKSNSEVIDYVSKTPNALGVIGVNWISDSDDSTAVSFKKNINVVGIKGDPGDKGDDYYYQPYQAYIATQQYPLIRNVYSISREPRTGLATGFASFLASDRGQKIILKSGLLPANAPIRIIQLK